jgi:hypothetical protein
MNSILIFLLLVLSVVIETRSEVNGTKQSADIVVVERIQAPCGCYGNIWTKLFEIDMETLRKEIIGEYDEINSVFESKSNT